jgi:hypothetical protein
LSCELEAELRCETDSLATALDATFHAEWTIEPWTVEVETEIESGAWNEQTAEIAWNDQRVSAASILRYEPAEHRFKDWRTELSWDADILEADLEYRLTRSRRWLIGEVAAQIASTDVEARLRLRSSPCSPLTFYDARLIAEYPICATEMTATIEIDADGFDELSVELESLPLGLAEGFTADIEIVRSLDDVEIRIDPAIDLSESLCFSLTATIGEGPLLTPVRITEVRVDGEISDVDVVARLILEPDDWIDDLYAAVVELSAENEIGGGRELEIETVAYWRVPGAGGLRFARLEATAGIHVTDRLTIESSVDLDLDTLSHELRLAFTVDW